MMTSEDLLVMLQNGHSLTNTGKQWLLDDETKVPCAAIAGLEDAGAIRIWMRGDWAGRVELL